MSISASAFPRWSPSSSRRAGEAIFHTENGILNFGEAPPAGEEDWDLINAGKKAVTLKPGAAFFHHADSFAMVRGGHLDVAILGAYEVAENGDLANWSTGPKGVPAVGGAMDLVHGAKRVAVITDHVTKDGKPKLVKRCTPAADRRRLRHARLHEPRRHRHRGRRASCCARSCRA